AERRLGKRSELRAQSGWIAEWDVPRASAGLEVDRNQRAPRRLRTWQVESRAAAQNAASHHVRRAVHARVLIVESRLGVAPVARVELVESNQLHERGDAVHGDDRDLALGIEGEPTPMRTADVRWHRERSLEARRRERAFVPERPNLGETSFALLRRDSEHIAQ